MLIQVVVVLLLAKVAEPAALGEACGGGNTDCTGNTPGQYSVCDGSTVCACQAGYADDGGGVCQPDLGSVCGASSECTAGAGGTNSECSTNCVCSSTYSNVGGVCKADLGTACTVVGDCGDANAACTGSVCVCASTHYDDDGTSTAGGTCTAGLALNAVCSGVTAAARDAACIAGHANTMCDGTNCVCASGYTEVSSACKADLGTTCALATDCGDANAACTSTTCVCASGYYDDNGASTGGGACQAVLTASCTDETNCGDVDTNAECTGTVGSKTCSCKSGYTGGSGDVCAQSAAGQIATSLWLCVSLVLLAAKTMLL